MTNKTTIALITGASSGIGMATAKAFATAGINLIICGRREDKLEALQQELSGLVKVYTLVFDVRNSKDVLAAIDSLPTEWKAIDILINSAGNAHGLSPVQEGDIADWDMMIDANVQEIGRAHV